MMTNGGFAIWKKKITIIIPLGLRFGKMQIILNCGGRK